jgi:two-component system chemotaxis response regulator CheB
MTTVLVVDDTILYRKHVADVISTIPGVRVVGSAPNGKIALSRIAMLKPDLVTLDVEMPEMNGIEVLEAAGKAGFASAFLMVSALTIRGADLSLKAIELGAIDVIAKPDGQVQGRDDFSRELRTRVEAFVRRHEIRTILTGQGSPRLQEYGRNQEVDRSNAPGLPQAAPMPKPEVRGTGLPRQACEIVAIGVSTGGPAALLQVIPKLPADFPVPIVVAQHMPPLFTASLAQSLASRGKLTVKEGENGEVIKPGVVYLAPGGRHMRIDLGADAITKIIRITDDPPENHCRPSVDYLFRSVARHFYRRALAVIMTGMGDDGARGAGDIRKSGGRVVVQDEDSSVVWGMPGATLALGHADAVIPLEGLAAELSARVR